MPKDIIHWMVAEKTAAKLASSPYGEALEKKPDCLMLGAVFLDALFYLQGQHAQEIRQFPDALHGTHGEDSFELLKLQIVHARKQRRDYASVAALVGLVAHVCADMTMHPMVYYYSGNYHAQDKAERSKAVRRHRLLETIMDIAACGGLEKVKAYSLNQYLNSMGAPLGNSLEKIFAVQGMAMSCNVDKDDMSDALVDAFRVFGRLQSYSTKFWIGSTLHKLKRYLPESVKEVAALFYAPQLVEQAGVFDKKFTYKHPVSGVQHACVLDDLIEQAVQRAVDLSHQLEDALFSPSPEPFVLRGGSLATGQNDADQEMRYYAPRFPLVDL